MKYYKEHYKEIKYNGFKWSGFWDNLHHFIKRETQGYMPLACNEEDLTNGNFECMVDYNLTRV